MNTWHITYLQPPTRSQRWHSSFGYTDSPGFLTCPSSCATNPLGMVLKNLPAEVVLWWLVRHNIYMEVNMNEINTCPECGHEFGYDKPDSCDCE
jgi:hypothetical protein